MGGKTISTSETRAEALTLQSSTYGATIPWLRGMHRLPGNLVWYGDFKAVPHTTTQGGKGGGKVQSTSYTYEASLVMGVCLGPILGITTVWVGKGVSNKFALGLTQLLGDVGQAAWSGLSGKGVQELGYSGLAAVAAQHYNLGSSSSVENHSFEVVHTSAYTTVAGIPDVDPAGAAFDLLTDVHEGAALPASVLGDWTNWSRWCVASGLLMSPAITEQVRAADALSMAAELTNAGIVWSDGKIKIVPYADQAVTGNGVTFTPSNTPVYQLDDTCFVPADGEAPVRVSLKTPTDLHNHVKVEYKDRSNGYQVAIAEAKDLTDISVNGLRTKPTIQAHWICTAAAARLVAELVKQRSLLVAGEYTFELPIHYALAECMDLLTLTDTVLQMDNVPVRVKQIVERDDDTLEFTCEDFPAGSANAPLYAAQVPAGFASNYLAAPGGTAAVVVFEGPGALTGNELQLWVAARGDGQYWGGCTVWVSLDGTTYRAMGKIQGGSRCGALTGAIASGVLPVQIGAAQQLTTASAADAAALNTLCYIGDGTPEYLAYTNAALTGAGAYNLSGLVRSAYGTSGTAHAGGSKFAFIDASIAKSDVIDPSYIGKTVYIKCTSFNVFGASEESLASVSATSYTVTGSMLQSSGTGVTVYLSSDAIVLPADSTGHVTSYALASTVASVILNGVDDTANWTFTPNASSGLSYSQSGATFTVTALADATDAATLTVVATKAGQPSLAKTLRVTKAKSGANGTNGTNGSNGSNGTPGTDGANGWRTADAKVYAWSASGAPSITGSSTYTWSTGALSAAPAGWSLTPGAPTAGFTLWVATVRISNTATTSTDTVNWTLASISPQGTAGATGTAGQSSRLAYTVISSGSTLGSGLRTSTGSSSVPASNAWGLSETWSATTPAYGTNQTVWQTNGIYDPGTNITTWDSPYISALKVGQLSAISANLGEVTAGTLTGTLIRTAASGRRVAINESGNGSARFYDDAGGGAELLATVGPTSFGSTQAIGVFGTKTAGNNTHGVLGRSYSAYGVKGESVTGNGVYGQSSSSINGGIAAVVGDNIGGGIGVVGGGAIGGYFIGLPASGYPAIKGDGGASFALDGVAHDPYGAVCVTRGTGSSFGYYGMVRSGQYAMGMGIDTASRWFVGALTSGHNGVLSGSPFMVASSSGLQVTGGFGCNGKSLQVAYALNAAATDAATTQALVNQIRQALINNGICV